MLPGQKKGAVASAVLIAFGIGASAPATVAAATEEKPQTAASPETPEVAPDSPRASVERFLDLVLEGKDADAALQLDLKRADKKQGAELARQLAAVLNAQPGFELEDVSPESTGNLEDQLPPDQETIGQIRLAGQVPEEIKLLKRTLPSGPIWIFASPTVERIPRWYDGTPSAWAQRHLPQWMSTRGPAGVHVWQWTGLLAIAILAWVLGWLLSRVAYRLATRITKRTKTDWDDKAVHLLHAPVVFAASLAVAAIASLFLGLPESTQESLFRWLKSGLFLAVFWIALRLVELLRQVLSMRVVGADRIASRSLLSLGSRVTKAALYAIAVIAVMAQLGFPVATLIAGLGIGGLAVALAGQKTLENLLGTFAIGIDQPFREGDYVRAGEHQGTVESIGLRSTRLRTPDRTVVTLPNGKLADANVESFAVRDRQRLFCTLAVEYGTRAAQLRTVLLKIETLLRDQKEIDADSVSVRLTGLAESGMVIEVIAMIETLDAAAFASLRQELFLRFMEILDEAKVSWAFPTRTLQVKDGVEVKTAGNGQPVARSSAPPPRPSANGH